jgi:hypothetical protein
MYFICFILLTPPIPAHHGTDLVTKGLGYVETGHGIGWDGLGHGLD